MQEEGENPPRVLVVEDEVLLALDLAETVEEMGARVVGPAHSVAAALKLADSEPLDFAFLDVNLGQEQSTPIAQTLSRRSVPFVFVSGYSTAHLPDFANVPAISKPATVEQIKAALRQGLARRGRTSTRATQQ